jgi:gliding motility-associated-like protein
MRSSRPLKHLFFLIAKVFLFCFVLFMPYLASAQTDRAFWFVAPNVYAGDANRNFNKPIYLRITTSTSAATVVISMPADPSFIPITRNIAANSTATVDLTPWINQLQNTPANTVLNKGLLITSTADITSYYEVVSGFCDCDPEIFSLKGKNALGTEFFISSQYTFDESTAYPGTNSFDIVATENNTHVTITPKQNIIGHNANIPFTVVLNKGQTYSAEALSGAATGHLQGSYISSDNPIAVTLKDDLVQVSSCADLIGDQAVPTNVLGTEYIVTKGFLDNDDEIYVLAIENNTSIYTNGGTSPIAVLAKGQSTTISLSASNIYIRSDKKIYVYHLTGNGCEVGSAVIPKLNCTGSKSVSIVRSKNERFAVMITTKNGNQNSFTVNGNATLVKGSDFAPVPGTGGEYVTSRVDLSSSVPVDIALNFSNSTGNFSLGFINGGTNTGTLYGFFSDFKSSNVQNASLETCPSAPVQLSAYGGVSYQWTPATGLSNPNIANPMASPAATTDYTVAITTADGCVDHANVHVKVNSAVTPAVTIVASTTNICPGTLVTFTATPVNGGTSPIYQWKVNGINAGTNSAIFNSATLINGDKVTCVMTSNAACATIPAATSNSITMNVNTGLPASVTIVVSQNNICDGTSVNFTATPVNGGNNPVYQWQVNGINVGTNSAAFSSSTLINGDEVTCKMTSTSSTCSVSSTVTSNLITMVVNANLPASVSIAASQNNVCEGTAVTFTATPVNGGSTPIYQWQVNGVNAGTNSATFNSTTFVNGDKVTCLMTSNATCATPVVSTSNEVIMGINLYVTPSVTITASTNNICPGESITFTATALNGGVTPSYQWQVNGVNAGTNSTTFSSTILVNGDNVRCVITSNATCTTIPTATSNSVIVNVNLPVSPSVTIASTNNVCYGTEVTFTATPTNGGNSPVYKWLVNGNPTGTNSNTFISSNLNNNDVVSCRLTSNVHCAVPATVTSNLITMVVNANLPASVSIAASQNNVCEGTAVTFTATPVNGGSTPIYQWQVNGVNAGTNSATFNSATFVNGDKVTCLMTSNATCAIPIVSASNIITMGVNPYITPSVSIRSSSDNICPGELITFTATPVNGGNSPSYQWQVNGVNAGTNSTTFSSTTLVNGDNVRCVITSNATCTTIPTATSTSIIVNVSPLINPSVTIASINNVCYGTTITFTATPTNGGSNPVYQWLLNGNPTGTNSNQLVKSNLSNNDIVSCRLTSSAHCAIPAMATSNSITMIINPLPVIDGGGNKTIEKGNSVQLNATASDNIADVTWSPSTGLSNTKILTPTASPDKTTLYTLTVKSAEGCTSTSTVNVTVQVHIIIPNTFTPNNDGVNDKWEIGNLADYPNADLKVFNRWGAEVYRSSGNVNSWDGTRNGKFLAVGTYYYVIKLDKNATPISGYVVLLR